LASDQQDLNRQIRSAVKRAARASLRALFTSTARRLLRDDYRAALAIYRAHGGAAVQTEFPRASFAHWFDGLYDAIADLAFSVTEPKSEILGELDQENPIMERWLEDYVSQLSTRLSATTYTQVMGVIFDAIRDGEDESTTAALILAKSHIQVPHRARLIARNELQRVTKGASWVQAVTSGVVVGKQRKEMNDDRTRESHRAMIGETQALTQPYSNGEMWAGETEINCRGWDEYVLDHEARAS
jgi:Phage Mu protein F like protein